MSKLIDFINKQTHYKAGEELDIARNNTLIFGTYNPPKDLGYINNYRFSINNNKKNNFLNFSKLLYEQTYNKLLNPESNLYLCNLKLQRYKISAILSLINMFPA